MSEAKRSTFMKRALIAVLAVALVFTMMPLSMGKVFAEGETPAVPENISLTVSGNALTETVTLDAQAFGAMDVQSATFPYVNNKGESNDAAVVGVTVENILKAVGADPEVYDIEKIEVVTSDKGAVEINPTWLLTADANGQKAMYIWSEDNEATSKVIMGGFKGMGETADGQYINRQQWQKNVTGLSVTVKEEAPAVPEDISLSVSGNALTEAVTLDAQAFGAMDVQSATFPYVNNKGESNDAAVVGVTVENILKAVGADPEAYDIEKIEVVTSDKGAVEINPTWLLTADANGQKAMYIWSEDNEATSKVIMGGFKGMGETADGQYINRQQWQKNVTGITVTGTKKPPVVPETISLTVKDVNGDKESTLTKDAFEGLNPVTVNIESVNSSGTVEPNSADGVTIESILKHVGIEESTYNIEKIAVITSDKGPVDIPVKYLLTADANGQKAMYIWTLNGKNDSRVIMGAIEGMDPCTTGAGEGKLINKSWWQKNVTGIEVTATKKKVEPTKVANTLTVTPKNKTFKAKALKKKAKSYKALTVKNAKGAVTYTVKYKNKKAKKALKFNKKTGMIKVTKKTKKGTYKVTVTVKAAGATIGDKIYLPKTVKKTITVKVK